MLARLSRRCGEIWFVECIYIDLCLKLRGFASGDADEVLVRSCHACMDVIGGHVECGGVEHDDLIDHDLVVDIEGPRSWDHV